MRGLGLGLAALTCAMAALSVAGAQRRAPEGGSRRRSHRVQHGHCSYTFVLPEADPPPCPPAPAAPGPANALLQRDSPAGTAHAGHGAAQRLRHLERILENSTQWLLKVGCGAAGGTGSASSTPAHSTPHPAARSGALPAPGCRCRSRVPGGVMPTRAAALQPGQRLPCRFATWA